MKAPRTFLCACINKWNAAEVERGDGGSVHVYPLGKQGVFVNTSPVPVFHPQPTARTSLYATPGFTRPLS